MKQHKRSGVVQSVEVQSYRFEDDGAIPNNPHLPLLVYPGVLSLPDHDPAVVCEKVFAANQWGNSWRNGIFSYHHYHSDAHEALAIARGQATVRFGGEQGETLTVRAGDVVVIPAGVGHKNLGASSDLLVVGAYPPGQRPDLHRGYGNERPQVLQNIRQVSLPPADPVYGTDGPLVTHWAASQ